MEQDKQALVKILLVEDAPLVLLAHHELMESLGCEVETAVNGQEAIEQLTHKDFDLVFLDMGLPDLSGLDVVKLMRQSPRHQHTPVVALTGYTRHEDQQAFLAAGVNQIVVKPVNLHQIQTVLQACCRHYQANQVLA